MGFCKPSGREYRICQLSGHAAYAEILFWIWIQPSQMAFLDKDMRWKIEKGTVDVKIGSSSEDIRLKGEYTVRENQWIEGKDRAFCAEVEVL